LKKPFKKGTVFEKVVQALRCGELTASIAFVATLCLFGEKVNRYHYGTF